MQTVFISDALLTPLLKVQPVQKQVSQLNGMVLQVHRATTYTAKPVTQAGLT